MTNSPWPVRPSSAASAAALSRGLDLHPVLATVLAARGITEVDTARQFLQPDLAALPDPFLLSSMAAAVERLEEAARNKEHVLIYGDYDVDGICGIIILRQALQQMGIETSYYIPNRLEQGYGVHPPVLKAAARRGVSVVVTVDTGISDLAAAAAARKLGLDLIITDHHAVPATLPPALAVLHPHLGDAYPNRDLSGAGVALKLVQALAQASDRPADFWLAALDLAALATIADVMPLTGENRIIAAAGLERLRRRPRAGLQALLQQARLAAAEVTAWHVSFQVAPRLNSPGRLYSADLAAELLLAPEEQAAKLARVLETQNKERRDLQEQIAQEIVAQVGEDYRPGQPLLAGDAAWHRGVLGVVAGRLARQFGVPVLLAREENGRWQGSGRSVPGFDLMAALDQAQHLLEDYGGHAQAAGFTVAAQRVPQLTAALAQAFAAAEGTDGPQGPVADAWVTADDVNDELATALARLEPCGSGNPPPLLAGRLPLEQAYNVGRDGSHLRLTLAGGTEAIAFGQGHLLSSVRAAGNVTALFTPGFNVWQGRRRLQLRVEELKPYRPRVKLHQAEDAMPASPRLNRPLMVGLYRTVRSLAAENEAGQFTWSQLWAKIEGSSQGPAPEQVKLGLQVFSELELLAPLSEDNDRWAMPAAPAGKVQLEHSPTYRIAAQMHGPA